MIRSRVHSATAFISLTLLSFCASSQTSNVLIHAARRTFHFNIGIEVAGLFWIGCEIAILFCMSVATRHLLARPVPKRLLLTPQDRRIAIGSILFFVLLSIAVFARHLFIAPLPDAITTILESSPGERISDIKSAYVFRARTHLFIWCLFITAWVALEIAIVAKGVRAYNSLRQLFSGHEGA